MEDDAHSRAPVRTVGRYAMFAEIAAGGMAAIHVGRLRGAAGLQRTVAIKRLHAQFAKDPEFVEMLLDEANLAARIRHPNVVSPIEVVTTRGELFLVMDYVQGESLSRLALAARRAGTAIPLEVTRSILADVLHGLHAAHEATSQRGDPLGIVHRDVSPQNVLVGVDGVARVLDFGIAKAVGRAATTRDGQVKGKIAYMAPECFEFFEVNRQSDIYAAAVVLWETLTGERLFKADTDSQTVARILANEVAPPSRLASEVSPELDAVVLRGLARDRSKRFDTAQEMALALQATGRKATATEVGEWVDRTAHAELAGRARVIAEMGQAGDRDIPSDPPLPPVAPPSTLAREMPTSRLTAPDHRRVAAAAPPVDLSRAWPPAWLRSGEARSAKGAIERCRLALFSRDDSEYQELLREDFLSAARGHGFSVRVFRAANDTEKQITQIQECLRERHDRRPGVVMVSPVREVPLLATAHEAARLGIGWVVLSRWWDYLNNLRAEFSELPIFAVVADQKEVGRIQGRQLAALLPSGGELVYIQGPLGTSSAVRRHAGVQEILQGSSIEVFTVHSDWTLGGGTRAMLDWARVFQKRELPRFIVGAQNDAMAMGARDAMQTIAVERGSSAEGVSFCGCDGSPSYGQRLVTEGKLAATVVLPASAGTAIAEVAAMLRGGPRPPAAIFLKPIPFPEAQFLVRSPRSGRPGPGGDLPESLRPREGTVRPPAGRTVTGRPNAKGRGP